MSKKKQKYQLEFEVKSSPRVLYSHLSTASGLEEWFADRVTIQEGDFVFHWEGSDGRAKIVNKKENQYIKYKWVNDDKKDDSYFQFDIIQDEITSDVALIVTDFSTPEEKEEDMLLWNSQIHALMHVIGS